MNVHFTYKVTKSPDIDQDINRQIEKLNKRLQVFRPELVHLKGIIEQNTPREGFVVSLNLRLPSGQMASQESAPAAQAALKGAFDDLLEQLTKHKDMLRSQYKWPRRRRVGTTRPQPQVPFEQTLAAAPLPTVSAEDVSSYVNANLGRLERFVEREITYREAAAIIPPDSVSREEVIDEAVARAMSDGTEKPERLALEPWLYRLSMQALDDLAGQDAGEPPAVSIHGSTRKPNVRGSDEPQLQYHQPDELQTTESTIADDRSANPEQIASSDEMVAMVYLALREARDQDREAFVLYALESFSIEEIAAITDRKPDQVRASIAAAREHLRQSPPISNRLKDKLLQKTGTI